MTSKETLRETEIDLLRTFAVLSAFILHYNSNFSIGIISIPSRIVQNYWLTVGGFFLFTAGYMACKKYIERFKANRRLCSLSLIRKGIGLIAVYAIYVLCMHFATKTIIPANMVTLFYCHRFFGIILLTFGLLYIVMPVLLFIFIRHRYVSIGVAGVLAILTLGYKPDWNIPFAIKIILFDRTLFLYSLVPSILLFSAGYITAQREMFTQKRWSSAVLTSITMVVFCVHMVLCWKVRLYYEFITDRNSFTLIEMITPIGMMAIARIVVGLKIIGRFTESRYLLCLGVFSFHFYLFTNLFIGLSNISKDSPSTQKIIVFTGIGILSYIITFWKYGSFSNYRMETEWKKQY
jgi:hypothetical protein